VNLTKISRRALAFAIFIAVVVFAAGTFLTSGLERPKDADLVAQFAKHKAVFDELRQMLSADNSLRSIEKGGVSSMKERVLHSTLADTGISKERYDLYVAKLQQCGVSILIHDEDEFRFAVAGSGFASKGYRIAITYTESKPTPLLPTLDDFKKTTHSWEQAYRHIEGNWYVWIIW
jgi:hypothetical protein